jgi:hypothetical protein
MNAHCILEFGTRHINVLEGTPRAVLRYASAPLGADAVRDGVPQPGVADAIRRLWLRAGLRCTVCRIAIPETGTSGRETEVPRVRKSELNAVVRYLAKRMIPMSAEDVYYAWDVRPRPDGGSDLTVQAALREIVDGYDRVCSQAGLRVEWVDLKPVALARALAVPDALVADWGLGELSLVLIHEGRTVYVHSLPLEDPTADAAADFEAAVFAFNSALTFVRSAYRSLPLEPPLPLFLCGRFAAVPDLAALARERFAFPLGQCPSPPTAPTGFQPAAFAAALGMLDRPASLRPRLTLQQFGIGHVA